MKYKLIILLFFVSNSAFGQFFDTEKGFETTDKKEVTDTIQTILPQKVPYSLVDSIVAHGKSFMGVPYHYGGTTPAAFDCSGFTQYVYRDFGYFLPRTATAQYLANTHIDRADLRKGDLVFFEGRKRTGKIGHVGMMVSDSLENGNFNFIHASVNRGVIVTFSGKEYYTQRYLSACRIVGADTVRTPRKNIVLKPAATSQTLQSTENKYHTVKKGESLYSISKKYGKTVAQLKSLNGLASDNLKIGQRLLITKGVKKVDASTSLSNHTSTSLSNHTSTSLSNHTSTSLSNHTSTSLSNQTDNDGNESVVEYIVKAGDTLYSISKRFSTTVEKIKQDNNLIDNNLKINQKLIIKR